MKFGIKDIVFLAAFAVVVLQISSFFRKASVSAALIQAKEQIKYLEKDRLKDSIFNLQRLAIYDSLLSLSRQRYEELETQKQAVKLVYGKIPAIIRNYSNEELRRAVWGF